MNRQHRSFFPASFAAAAVLALCAFPAPSARAQDIPSAADAPRDDEEVKGDTRVAEIREVERGFFFSVDAGANYFAGLTYFQPVRDIGFFAPVNENWLQPGSRVGLRLGYDILNNLDIEAFVLANFNRGPVKSESIRQGILTGDVAHFAPGVAARFAFITTDRLFVFGRAGVGLALWYPPAIIPGSLTQFVVKDFAMGVHTDASLGVEYYTRLRHISVGFEVAVQGLLLPFAVGIMAYPTIKYTF